MNDLPTKRIAPGRISAAAGILLMALLLVSCARIDPGKVNMEFEKTHPEPKITTYTEALMKLGMMSTIYETETIKVQSIPIYDNTGASVPTGGEIPKDISEMVKSTLNSIGGNLIYIPLIEEKKLTERFGNEYLIYKKNVPRWIPRLSSWKPCSARNNF